MDMDSSSSTATQNQIQPENAFDGLAPESQPKSAEPWDIFINHRGCDVKYTLATTIYNKLHPTGLHVFLDKDALEAGDSIPAEIQHAITTATLHIAIFSPNYAESPWCLAELSFMLKSRAKIIPIFYHVDPSDLRWAQEGKGKYADAFSEHERKGRYKQEKLGVWRRALHDISFKSGHLINNNEEEATVLKNIVNSALKIMNKAPIWVAEHPLGLDELVQGFESVATEETVKIVGIVGMGGSGKTTLAKELYNRKFSSFKRRSFVFDVRDAASRNALPEKQKKLLSDLGVHHEPFDHADVGRPILENNLSSHRALIVLDDVDDIDQLDALLPNKHNLGSQSMVIVTSRELGVLKSWGLSCIYNMPTLAGPHAKQLFCWHAFLQPSPPAEFEILVEDFLKACNGLPLSLKVLGGQLYGNDSRAYWKSQLHKISRILPGKIKKRLQISYDALDEEEKEMFLDVACFFIGEEKSKAIAVWDGSGWSGLQGLETLVNKCLVELVEYTRLMMGLNGRYRNRIIEIRMHDQLRDMGREIASRQSPHRLWCLQKIDILKKHSMGTMQIRGIHPADAFVAFKEYMHRSMGISRRQSKRLRFSNELQILSLEGNELTEEFASLTEDLVWLRWDKFPLKNVPSWLTLKNVTFLELRGAEELRELWQGNADPPLRLIELILEGCTKLLRLPRSIGRLQHLKRLQINFVGSSLSEESGGLQSLECLQLVCPVLSLLPVRFGNLTSLRTLKLEAMQLGSLPDSFCQLIHLEILDLSGCYILSSLPADFGNLTSLRDIDLSHCWRLSMLPDSFSQLIHLEVLDSAYFKMLSSLPVAFGNLRSLRNIKIHCCKKLEMLPDSFSQLIHLEDLDLSGCEMLSSLPAGFGNLTSLRDINLRSCEQLSMLPDSFSQLIHLEVLDLTNCKTLSSLPVAFGNLRSLRNIKIYYCKKLEMLPDSFSQLIHLKKLSLSGCEMLSSLPVALCNLIHLETLSVESRRLKEIETLPVLLKYLGCIRGDLLKNIGCISGLINLEELEIIGCPQLEELPSFADLVSLNRFVMRGCPAVEKIQGLEHAKSLKTLIVHTSWRVPGIQSLEGLDRLEWLVLRCGSMSAVKPCIESIKGKQCLTHMEIEGSVIHLVEPIVNPLEFSDLTVTEVDRSQTWREWSKQIPYERGSDALLHYMELKDVVRILFTEDENCNLDPEGDRSLELRKERVAWGKRGRVVEAFYRLLGLLQ